MLRMGCNGHSPCELGMPLVVTVSSGQYHRALGTVHTRQSLGKMLDGINHGVMRPHMVPAQDADACKKHLSAQEPCQLTAVHMPPRSLYPAIGWIDQASPHLQMVCPDVALFDLGVVNGHGPSSHRALWIIAFFFLLFFLSFALFALWSELKQLRPRQLLGCEFIRQVEGCDSANGKEQLASDSRVSVYRKTWGGV